MRKSFVAIFVLAVLAAFFLFRRGPETSDTSKENVQSSPDRVESVQAESGASPRPRWVKPTRTEAGKTEPAPSSKAVVYDSADFARGELQNIVVDDGIRLGHDSSFVPRFNPKYRIFGNFISPEMDASQPFDALSLNVQASELGENEVVFEFRTRAKDGTWSEWREAQPQAMKEPFQAAAPRSTGWQFRVALFANDPASSPIVKTVAIEPLSNDPQNFSANNNTN